MTTPTKPEDKKKLAEAELEKIAAGSSAKGHAGCGAGGNLDYAESQANAPVTADGRKQD